VSAGGRMKPSLQRSALSLFEGRHDGARKLPVPQLDAKTRQALANLGLLTEISTNYGDWVVATPAGRLVAELLDDSPGQGRAQAGQEVCEGCENTAEHHDVEGVPLCCECWKVLCEETMQEFDPYVDELVVFETGGPQ